MQQQEWERELAAVQSAAAAREAALQAQLVEVRSAVEAQAQTIARLLRGSIIVVDQHGCGWFTTVSAALEACCAGDTVVVRGGDYTEQLNLKIAGISIRGTESPPVVLRSGAPAPVLTIDCDAVVMGLTLVQDHPGQPAVRCASGAAVLEHCDVTGLEQECVVVEAAAMATLRHCRVHGGQSAGVVFRDGSRGAAEFCRIFGHDGPNVHVRPGAEVAMRSCKLFDSKACGLLLAGASGDFEDNEIYNSATDNVQILSGAPRLLRNRIHSAQHAGIHVVGGAPELTHNEVYDNNGPNVTVAAGARPLVAHNVLHHSRQHGILVHAGGGGEIRDNNVHDNIGRPILLEDGARATVHNPRK